MRSRKVTAARETSVPAACEARLGSGGGEVADGVVWQWQTAPVADSSISTRRRRRRRRRRRSAGCDGGANLPRTRAPTNRQPCTADLALESSVRHNVYVQNNNYYQCTVNKENRETDFIIYSYTKIVDVDVKYIRIFIVCKIFYVADIWCCRSFSYLNLT